MKISFDFKKNLKIVIAMSVLLLALLISLLVFIISGRGSRKTFVFPSVDEGQYVVEARYLHKNPLKNELSYYVDEILLGSQLERTQLIFPKGTKALSCFKDENDVLYINLSQEVLNLGDNILPTKEGIELLTKNIKQNFSGIKSVEIYVDGKGVFENY